jgi:hypothetical protein
MICLLLACKNAVSASPLDAKKEKDEWQLMMDGQLLKTYDTDELRVAIVYRARCFKSEEARQVTAYRCHVSMQARPSFLISASP